MFLTLPVGHVSFMRTQEHTNKAGVVALSYMGKRGRGITSSKSLLELQNEFKITLDKLVRICLNF